MERISRAEQFNRDFINAIKTKKSISPFIKSMVSEEISRTSAIYGGYGGGYGRTSHVGDFRSGGAKWPGGLSNSGYGRILNHYLLRRNARDAYHDTPQARALVERYADTVADIGLRLESMPKPEILGISPEEAESWANDVESRFDLFMKDKKQHRSETINGYQAQRLYQIFQHRDNDIFIRFYYSKEKRLQNPLQYEFIDPDQIRGDAFTSTFGVHGHSDGIERDERGREKTYQIWIRNKEKGKEGQYEAVDIKARGPKSGRIFMIHGYSPEYAGQGRGYSRLGFALQEFENITDFSMAHIKKAINQSQIFASIENKDLDPSNPLEGILTNMGAGPASDQFGSVPNPDAEAINVTENALRRPECYSLPEATSEVAGSMMIANMQRGDTLKEFSKSAPVDSFDKFVDAFTSYLSAAMGMPLEVVLMRFNQNFSASRGALLLFWRVVLIWRDEMAADFLNHLYEMWLSGEIASGRISAAGWSDPVLKAAWLNNRWIGSPAPDIDPSKTAKARKDNIEIGITNIESEARGFNGSSAQTNIEKNRKLFKDFPIAPWSKAAEGGQNNPNKNNKDIEDEED